MCLVCSMENKKQIGIRQEKRIICDTIVSLFWKVPHHRKAGMPFTDDGVPGRHGEHH